MSRCKELEALALTCLRFAQHVSSLAQACFDMTSLPARALLVQPHWCDEILAGRKTWEIRGSSLGVRGRVALAACGTGTSVGEITFVDALPVGRRDEGGTLLAVPGNEIHFMALPENMSKQGVNDLKFHSLPPVFRTGTLLAPVCGPRPPWYPSAACRRPQASCS